MMKIKLRMLLYLSEELEGSRDKQHPTKKLKRIVVYRNPVIQLLSQKFERLMGKNSTERNLGTNYCIQDVPLVESGM